VLPFWIAAVVISRDLILVVGALAIHMAGGRITPRPSAAGKLATFFQVLTVLGGLLGPFYNGTAGAKVVMWLAVTFTVVSGLQYIVQGMGFLNASHVDEDRESDETPLFR
jgi:cardiolipin synthase